MARWPDLVRYIKSNYRIDEETEQGLTLQFGISDTGRSQRVIVHRSQGVDSRDEWALIMSPVAKLGAINLERALEAASSALCGGLVLHGTLLVFRHAVPLENLDLNEFVRPLELVMVVADDLERRLAGSDTF
jgi:hypothetical protein